MKRNDDAQLPVRGEQEGGPGTAAEREAALLRSVEEERVRVGELAAVLDIVPAAVWIARDPRGDHIDANRLGAELLRRPRGHNVSLTAPADDRPRNFVVKRGGRVLEPDELPIQRAARGEEVRDWDEEVCFDDGQVLHLVGNATPIRDAKGGIRGSVGAFIDVTARREAELALARREAELREADRRKNEFLALLSHELRNPLAAIRQALTVLERTDEDTDAARRARKVLQRQEQHLSRLVDDLLDVGRIAHGRIEVRLEPVEARELVGAACLDNRPLFEQRGVTLVVDGALGDAAERGAGAEPLWVLADGARLSQMVGNLLHNALKFTPAGGRVAVSVTGRGEAVEIAVRDDGLGLEPAQLERIFEPFIQVAPSSGGQGGLGLGLSLVRELAARHSGAVRAHSDGLGRGAEFVIALPRATTALAAPASPLPPPAPAPAASAVLSVLIVEDNEDAATTLADLVALGGHRARTAVTGRAGLESCQAEPPDVLLCDIGLPDMSGYELLRSLRVSLGSRCPFAVALTGYALPEDVDKARAAGFDAHIAKPPAVVVIERLLAQVAAAQRTPSTT